MHWGDEALGYFDTGSATGMKPNAFRLLSPWGDNKYIAKSAARTPGNAFPIGKEQA